MAKIEKGNTGYYHPIINLIMPVAIGLSAYGIGLGLMYVFNGEPVFPIIITIVLVGILTGIAIWLKNLKTKKRKSEYKKPEYILWGVYALPFIASLIFFAHFFNIEFNKKDDFKRAGLDRLEEIKTMRDEYKEFSSKKITSFEDSLKTATGNYFIAINQKNNENQEIYKNKIVNLLDIKDNNSIVDFSKYKNPKDSKAKTKIKAQIESAGDDKITTIKSTYNLGKVNTKFEKFYKKSKQVFEKWDKFMLSKTFYDIDIEYAKLQNETKRKSKDEFIYKDLEKSSFSVDNPFDISASFFVAFIIFAILNYGILSVYIHVIRYEYKFKESEEIYAVDDLIE